MNEEPGDAIKRRLRELGLSQAKFSRMVGKSPGWAAARFLPNVENMLRYLAYKEPETIDKILWALDWDLKEFADATRLEIVPVYAHKENFGTATLAAPSSGRYEYVGPPDDHLEEMGAQPVTSTMKVPILGTVSAGRGETTVELEGELEVPEEVLRRYRSYNLFALRVTGDSMYCEDLPISIPPGAYVVAAADLAAQPGDVVVAWHEPTQTGFLKEWHPKRGHQVLRSWNPDVPPILIQPDDPIDIQGVVVNVTFNPRQIRKERKGRGR